MVNFRKSVLFKKKIFRLKETYIFMALATSLVLLFIAMLLQIF